MLQHHLQFGRIRPFAQGFEGGARQPYPIARQRDRAAVLLYPLLDDEAARQGALRFGLGGFRPVKLVGPAHILWQGDFGAVVLGSIGTAGINGGFKEWAARVKTFKDGVREAEAATEALNRAVSDGTVNMEMINRATAAATLKFGRLDDATLGKLNAAVAAARDKMAALKDEAADTVAQLQTELARLRGDGEQARRLEEERKLRELNVKLAEAEAQGNSEAAARYRQAVSLQRQIYRERAEQEEQAEKARAENPQAGLAAAFEAALPQIGIPLSDLQHLIEARDKRVAEAAAERVIAGLEAAFRRTV